jgi:plasmid stabilization system protein ParE
MVYKIILKMEASEDILDAWTYYEEIQQGLGDRFEQSLYSRVSDLSIHPAHYGYLHGDNRNIYRSVMIKKFPFQIVYEVQGNEVIIYGVIHVKRHPAFIFKRLPG